MKKINFVFLIVVISVLIFSCEYYSYGLEEFLYRSNTVSVRAEEMPDLSGKNGNFEDLEIFNKVSGKKYTVLFITDVHFGGENSGKNGARPELLFLEWLKNLKETNPELYPSFAICLGDIAEHGHDREFIEYKFFTDKLNTAEYGNIKTFNVVGNHDLYNSGWEGFKKFCYPYTSFYKFRTKGFTWYFVDSASCSIGEDQLTTLSRDMIYNEKGRKKLVFTHVPVYANGVQYFVMQNTTERNRFISLLADENTSMLVDGHTHSENKSDLGFIEWNLPGFLEKYGFGLMFVDETNPLNPTAQMKVFYLK